MLAGLLFGARVIWHYLSFGVVGPYLPSAVLTAVLFIVGFQVFVLGLIADMVRTNKIIIEENFYTQKKLYFSEGRKNR